MCTRLSGHEFRQGRPPCYPVSNTRHLTPVIPDTFPGNARASRSQQSLIRLRRMPVSTASPVVTRMPKTSLAFLVLISIVNFYDRNVGGALAEPMRHEFGLNDSQIGWIGTAFTLLYAVIGLPFGRIADTRSRKKLLAGGVALWGALTAFAAWAINLPMLIFSRLGLGVGEAACAPTATSWIGDLFPAERRSKPLALFMLGVPIGGGLSFIFNGPVSPAL